MIYLKTMNDNPLSKRWEKRYNEQSLEIRERLDKLDDMNSKDYQMKIIKRDKNYPEKGDVFIINPFDDVCFWGIVLNNHITNINGEELLVIAIFDERVTLNGMSEYNINFKKLLIEPSIVGKEYWTKGYFSTVGKCDLKDVSVDYGFYSIGKGKYFDEYGNELLAEPALLGCFGVCTISGIAYDVNKELIIKGLR